MAYRDTLTHTMGSSVSQSIPKTQIEKHPYVAKQRIKDDMAAAQKQGIMIWNSLISKLQEADLMEEKK